MTWGEEEALSIRRDPSLTHGNRRHKEEHLTISSRKCNWGFLQSQRYMYHAKNYGSNNRIFPKHAYVQDSLLRVLSHSPVGNPTNCYQEEQVRSDYSAIFMITTRGRGFLQMQVLTAFRSWFHLPTLQPQERILLQYRKGLSVSEGGASVTSRWRLGLLDWCIPGNKDRFLLRTCILSLTQF